MNSVHFKWKEGRIEKDLLVSASYARDKAIHLAELLMLDKISDVSYTTIIDGAIVTKTLDYFNDIL